jgi:hypothetical protein
VATPDKEVKFSELGHAVIKRGNAIAMETLLNELMDALEPEAVMNIPSEMSQLNGMNALNY